MRCGLLHHHVYKGASAITPLCGLPWLVVAVLARGKHHGHMAQLTSAVEKYFEAWNAHDQAAVEKLHAPQSSLKDWDASFGPTNTEVAKGIAGIWSAVPGIKIEVVKVYTQVGKAGESPTVVANIKVVVDDTTTLDVVDVITFDEELRITSLDAFKV